MPAFEALDHYHPALIVVLGVATFAGTLGSGLCLLRALRLHLPGPWAEVAAALVGVAALSLAVQLLGMSGMAGRPALVGVWSAFLLLGGAEILRRARGSRWTLPHLQGRMAWLVSALLFVAAALNLLQAAAPSTKIDEIYYQMLAPARIVLDGSLQFYLRPYLSSILPQMGYMIAATPLHALGYQDAPNVWSWCLGMLLAWFAARLVYQETGSVLWGIVVAAAMQVGLHPAVYYTTGGSHAPGDLATAAAVLALVFRKRLLRESSAAAYVFLLSISCLVAASSKISLLPLSALILTLGVVMTLRAAPGSWLRIAGAAALPWVVFYIPLCLWTLWQSGSPFGPILANVFAPSAFDHAVLAEMAASREVNQGGLLFALKNYVLHYPLVFTAGAAAALFLASADSTRRWLIASLLIFQVVLVALLLPHQARFLSGLHHALLVVGLIQVRPRAERWLENPLIALLALAVLILPWFGVQAYRTYYLAPVAIGFEAQESHYRRFIALYDDLREMDRILPEDAVLFARNRLASIYFPRPIYMHHRDLPAGRRVFALLGTSDRPLEAYDCGYMRLPATCHFAEPVYTNPEARYEVFRTPGRMPSTSRLEVREVFGFGAEGDGEADASEAPRR